MSSALNRALGTAPQLADGCCRLSVASSTSLLLSPFNGNILFVGGSPYQIPSAGISYASSGNLAASTLYYVYVYLNAGVLTLSLSTTAYAVDASGRRNLSSNSAYRLVGMIYTNTAASPFVDSTSFRGCLNWFNRRSLGLSANISGNTASGTYVALSATPVVGLFWSDELLLAAASGNAYNNTASAGGFATGIGIDGAISATTFSNGQASANAYGNPAVTYFGTVTEGLHSFNLYGYSAGGNGTANFGCVLNVQTRG